MSSLSSFFIVVYLISICLCDEIDLDSDAKKRGSKSGTSMCKPFYQNCAEPHGSSDNKYYTQLKCVNNRFMLDYFYERLGHTGCDGRPDSTGLLDKKLKGCNCNKVVMLSINFYDNTDCSGTPSTYSRNNYVAFIKSAGKMDFCSYYMPRIGVCGPNGSGYSSKTVNIIGCPSTDEVEYQYVEYDEEYEAWVNAEMADDTENILVNEVANDEIYNNIDDSADMFHLVAMPMVLLITAVLIYAYCRKDQYTQIDDNSECKALLSDDP